MPLYDCLLLFKPSVSMEAVIDLVARVGKHVYRRNGVLTDVKCLGREVQLGYGIKKLDGRYYQAKLMQMTIMTPPSFNSELYYLNKEDRLLRWLLIKHREMKFGDIRASFFGDDDATSDLRGMRSNLFDDDKIEENDDDDDDDDDDEQEGDEYSETKKG